MRTLPVMSVTRLLSTVLAAPVVGDFCAKPPHFSMNQPFHDSSLVVQMLHALGGSQQLLVSLEAPHGVLLRVFAGAAFGSHQVQRYPSAKIAALPSLTVCGFERSQIDGVLTQHDVVDM